MAVERSPTPRRPRDHVEGGAQRPFGIVLMRDRRAEQGEQRIADEFVDEAAKALHRRRQFLEQLVLQRLHDLGVELLAERGEAAEVGEQDRDGAAIGLRVLRLARRRRAIERRRVPLMRDRREGWRRGRLGGAVARARTLGSRPAPLPTAVPQRGQKAKSGAQAKPQLWHVFGCFAPHFGQNAKPVSIWKPQSAQFIDQVQGRGAAALPPTAGRKHGPAGGRASGSPSRLRSGRAARTS